MKIKYDKRLINICIVLLVIAVLSLGAMFLLFMQEKPGMEILALLLLYEGVGVGIFSLANLISGIGYLGRLKAYGYEVPYNRKDYDSKLENLPRVKETDAKSIFSKHSILSMYISVIAFLVFMALNVLYLLKWKFMGEDVTAMFILCSILHISWIIIALFFRKQSNPLKYRDDVEIDDSRKPRWDIGKAIVNMAILGMISSIAISSANSMTDYVFKTRISTDRDRAERVCSAVLKSISNCDDEQIMDSEQTLEELQNGIDIATWGEPLDPLQKEIIALTQMDDFISLRNKFYMSNADSQLWVKLDSNKVTVELMNPKKEFIKYSKNYKEIKMEKERE